MRWRALYLHSLLGLAPIGTRGLRHRECPSQSPSYSLEAARPRGRASARRVLEAAPGSATCDGRRFQDPELISLSPWHNGWTEITPFQYAAALGGKGGSGIVACEGGRRERPGGCDPSSCVTRCEAYLTRSTLLSLLGIALYAAEFSRHLHTCRSCSLPSPHPAHHTRFRHITNPRTPPLGRVTHLRFKQLFHRSCSNDYIANALLRLSVNRGFSRILAREPINSPPSPFK